MDWIASVKPKNSNILPWEEDHSVFEEIVIISVQTEEGNLEKNARKIADLVQKYIPYHILLCIYNGNDFILNTCDKRVNQNDLSKRTIEKQYFTESISIHSPGARQRSFLESMSFAGLDKQNLKAYYDAYTSRVIALKAAGLTDVYVVRNFIRSRQDVQVLETLSGLDSEINTLQGLAKKEPQLNIQVVLNRRIQEKRAEIRNLKKRLQSDEE